MRKVRNIYLVAVLVAAMSVLPALAQGGADVQKDSFTGGPVFTPIGVGTIHNSNYVQAPSGNWHITVQATLNDPANFPSRAVTWDETTVGTFCLVAGQERIHLVVTPSGMINLSCSSR